MDSPDKPITDQQDVTPAQKVTTTTPGRTGRSTFKEDLEAVWQAADRVALLLTLISLGLPGVIAKLFDPVVNIWQVIVLTGPLTAAVALIGTGIIRGWVSGVPGFILLLLGTVVATTLLGNFLQWGGAIKIDPEDLLGILALIVTSPLNPIGNGLRLLMALLTFLEKYFQLYGAERFLSSLVIGAFLAWAWGKKVLPHLAGSAR